MICQKGLLFSQASDKFDFSGATDAFKILQDILEKSICYFFYRNDEMQGALRSLSISYKEYLRESCLLLQMHVFRSYHANHEGHFVLMYLKVAGVIFSLVQVISAAGGKAQSSLLYRK